MQGDELEKMPEYALVLAVLKRGVHDAVLPVEAAESSEERRARQEARAWVRSDDQRLFGFEWCCDIAGLDASAIRSAVFGRPASVKRAIESKKRRVAA